MLPKNHLLFGIIFALVLLVIFPQIGIIGFSLVALSSVLIDVDHYLFYVYKKKNLSIKKAFQWNLDTGKKFFLLPESKRKEVYGVFCFLHGIEVLALLFFLSLFFGPFIFIFLGFTFHMFFDVLSEYRCIGKVTSKFSIALDYIRIKNSTFIDEYKK